MDNGRTEVMFEDYHFQPVLIINSYATQTENFVEHINGSVCTVSKAIRMRGDLETNTKFQLSNLFLPINTLSTPTSSFYVSKTYY